MDNNNQKEIAELVKSALEDFRMGDGTQGTTQHPDWKTHHPDYPVWHDQHDDARGCAVLSDLHPDKGLLQNYYSHDSHDSVHGKHGR